MKSKLPVALFWLMLLISVKADAQQFPVLKFMLEIQSEDKRLDGLSILIRNTKGELRKVQGEQTTTLYFSQGDVYELSLTKPETKAKKIIVNTNVSDKLDADTLAFTLHILLFKREKGERTREEQEVECHTEATVFYNLQLKQYDYRRGD
jgi:hypothetical protein